MESVSRKMDEFPPLLQALYSPAIFSPFIPLHTTLYTTSQPRINALPNLIHLQVVSSYLCSSHTVYIFLIQTL